MSVVLLRTVHRIWLVVVVLGAFGWCAASPATIYVSVPEQRLAFVAENGAVAVFAVSTSKFGLGDEFGSYCTPLGWFEVCEKIGGQLPSGAVLKNRATTGEVVAVNAEGRNPIVTRILGLEGLESRNANARARGIYIHGTPEESRLGQPVSWGCIRMRSRDVAAMFAATPVGAQVLIANSPLAALMNSNVGRVSVPISPAQPFLSRTRHAASARLWYRLTLDGCAAPLAFDFSDLRYATALALGRGLSRSAPLVVLDARAVAARR